MATGTSQEAVGRVEELLERLEALPDTTARDTALEAVAALLELYGEGLARIVDHVAGSDRGELAQAFAQDELVSHLLLLHDLHPAPVEERVRGALEEVRPYLESHGGGVELLGVQDGVARLRLEGSCSGCPSSAVTLKLAVEEAINKAAPDLVDIEAEGAVAPAPPRAAGPVPVDDGLIQLEVIGSPAGGSNGSASNGGSGAGIGGDETGGSWVVAGSLAALLEGGGPRLADVAGQPVLFLGVEGSVYAYRPSCPSCGRSLADGTLSGEQLACPGCRHRYDVRRAGRCVDEGDLHLPPVPLLVDEGGDVRVALG